MRIFNLTTLINNPPNIKKKHGDENYFQFYAVVHALNERPSGEHRD